jgi:hypothetical protein
MRMRSIGVLVGTLFVVLACGGTGQQVGQQQQWGAGPPAGSVAVPQVSGPVQTPDGALVWMDGMGRLTGVYPDQGMLFFGTQAQISVSRDAYGTWYAVQADKLTPLGGMPDELMQWPGVTTDLPGGMQLPAPVSPPAAASGAGYDPSIAAMQNMNNMYHETNMSIIDNMSTPSTDYYSNDGQYLGSW